MILRAMDTHTIMPVKRSCVHRFGCGRRSLRYIGRRCDSPIQGLAGCHSVYIWHKCLVQFGKLYALWGAKRSGWQSWHLACVHVCAHLLVSGPPATWSTREHGGSHNRIRAPLLHTFETHIGEHESLLVHRTAQHE